MKSHQPGGENEHDGTDVETDMDIKMPISGDENATLNEVVTVVGPDDHDFKDYKDWTNEQVFNKAEGFCFEKVGAAEIYKKLSHHRSWKTYLAKCSKLNFFPCSRKEN